MAARVRRFTQELQALELRPTYEDVFQAEASTVEEYLQQVHQMTVISAIQACHRPQRPASAHTI